MVDYYTQLEEYFRRLAHLAHGLTFLQWDQLVMMPPGGNETRSESVAELSSMYHELLSSPELGDLLEGAEASETHLDRKTSIREMVREYRWATCIPASLVKAKSLAGSRCEHQWRRQRQENDWKGFLKNFKEVVTLSREEAQARQGCNGEKFPTPYDAMLDLYCTGDSSTMISEIFSVLKEALPPLIREVCELQASRPPQLKGDFPVESQKLLNRVLAEQLGFDFQSGRIDESSHPFSTGDTGDHRITSRYRCNDFIDALKATAHEAGHAAYEGGLPLSYKGLPVGQARNMSIHESQSLLFEKQLFLSKPFLNHFTPLIHAHLGESRPYDWEMVWLKAIEVKPSYIRVEADELSYPLHVIIRYEIESALINGTMEPEAIPDAWDEKMRDYLGLSTSGNYKDGCLQDIHWTDGSFGYFPAYTLGALNGAQIFGAYCREHPDWQESLAKGDTAGVRIWLKDKIWSQGRVLESQQLMQAATGTKTSPDAFLSYIRDRYLDELF